MYNSNNVVNKLNKTKTKSKKPTMFLNVRNIRNITFFVFYLSMVYCVPYDDCGKLECNCWSGQVECKVKKKIFLKCSRERERDYIVIYMHNVTIK